MPSGFRTLAHEFAHYALYLFDEYFAYQFDQSGNLVGESPAYCTGPANRNLATQATNASVMDYHYTSSELSMQGVPGLWSSLCQQTVQWQLHGESAWETVIRKYADTAGSPRWQFITPADRGGVLPGPTSLPDNMLDLPQIVNYQEGASPPVRQLTVYGPDGPHWESIVALYSQDGRVIDQGFTDNNGRLNIYGANEGDTIRAATIDGRLNGSATVDSDHLTITFGTTTNNFMELSTGGFQHVRLIPISNPNPTQIDLLISLENLAPNADPAVIITEPGSETGQAPSMSYNSTTNSYEGRVTFSATERGMGRIQAFGVGGNNLVRLQTTYRLQHVTNDQEQDLYANDGNLNLHLESGSLPGNEAYFIIMTPGAIPGPLPDDLVLIGDPYAIIASGALSTLEKPAILTLRYDQTLVSIPEELTGLGIYRWDLNQQVWEKVPGHLDEDRRVMVASITMLDTFALLAPPGSWNFHKIFLPLIHK